jgi:transposase-like protein
MTNPATDLLSQLPREQAIRAKAAQEMWEREHQAIQGLARNAVRHGVPVATVARESGVSRVTLYHWLRSDPLLLPRATVAVGILEPAGGLGADSKDRAPGSVREESQDRGRAADVLLPQPSVSALG